MEPLGGGRGLNPLKVESFYRVLCRPSRGGVDWNQEANAFNANQAVAPRVGAWIETH